MMRHSGLKGAVAIGIAVVCGVAVSGCSSTPVGSPQIETDELSFVSGGKEIEVEHFAPALMAPGKHAAVIVVHGSDGFLFGGSWYRDAAKRVAAGGYDAYLVHYFNRTGDWHVTDVDEIHAKVPVWTATMKDAVNFVEMQPQVDKKRIGMVGISLGGAVAIATAAQDHRVKVLVDYFGFIPKTYKDGMKLPPTLIIHGTADKTVWPSNSVKLDAILTAQKVPHELKLYEGEGHGFRGKAGEDADKQTALFLKTYL